MRVPLRMQMATLSGGNDSVNLTSTTCRNQNSLTGVQN
jgi:hypothetical protein